MYRKRTKMKMKKIYKYVSKKRIKMYKNHIEMYKKHIKMYKHV